MDCYKLSNSVKIPTCFKSDSPRCIDLILRKRERSFESTATIHTGLSDFHAMVVAVLKLDAGEKGLRSLHIKTMQDSVRRTSGKIFVIGFRLNCRITRIMELSML